MYAHDLRSGLDFIRKRHNRRVVKLLVVFAIVLLGGFWAASSFLGSPGERTIAMVFIAAVLAILTAVGMVRIYRLDKRDCLDHSVVCPHCDLHLYEWSRVIWGGPSVLSTGECGHCRKPFE